MPGDFVEAHIEIFKASGDDVIISEASSAKMTGLMDVRQDLARFLTLFHKLAKHTSRAVAAASSIIAEREVQTNPLNRELEEHQITKRAKLIEMGSNTLDAAWRQSMVELRRKCRDHPTGFVCKVCKTSEVEASKAYDRALEICVKDCDDLATLITEIEIQAKEFQNSDEILHQNDLIDFAKSQFSRVVAQKLAQLAETLDDVVEILDTSDRGSMFIAICINIIREFQLELPKLNDCDVSIGDDAIAILDSIIQVCDSNLGQATPPTKFQRLSD